MFTSQRTVSRCPSLTFSAVKLMVWISLPSIVTRMSNAVSPYSLRPMTSDVTMSEWLSSLK